MAQIFANSGDPNQMPHSAASDLGLHCLVITLLEVSQLQWVKIYVVGTHLKHFTNTHLHNKNRKRLPLETRAPSGSEIAHLD